MKKIISIIAVCLFGFLMIQELISCTWATKQEPYAYNQVDVEPRFPAGEKAFFMYLRKSIPSALNADQTGIASFTVGKEGFITDVKIVKSVDDAVDAEAIRAFQNSPKWIPAKKDGKAVDVTFTLPFSFTKRIMEKHNN